MGDAAYPIRVRPLSDQVKALLRPRRAYDGFGGTVTADGATIDGGTP